MNEQPEKRRLIERRIEPRVSLRQSVEVHDPETGEPLGRMLNLSRTGFMLLREEPIEPGTRLRTALALPGHERVALEARCMWCQRSSYSDTFGAGFLFTSVAPAAEDLIVHLLRNSS